MLAYAFNMYLKSTKKLINFFVSTIKLRNVVNEK